MAHVIPEGAPRSGVIHIRHRHTERFTVIGNHLAQHEELSAAIGLAVYIQSLPDGVSVAAKALALRFREGEKTVRRALNELERAGYLARPRLPVGGGKFATRTLAYDKPRGASEAGLAPEPHPAPGPSPDTLPLPPKAPRRPGPPGLLPPAPPPKSSSGSGSRIPVCCSPPGMSSGSLLPSRPGWTAPRPPPRSPVSSPRTCRPSPFPSITRHASWSTASRPCCRRRSPPRLRLRPHHCP
ncbi:hypothetical protein [Streptomyces sp. NPDC096030]|uniref:hypothetical protein n=1 Tax=Streptomyces sp. NPDC096030 TaxID=3155423 RepID=UPI003325F71B